MADKAAKRDELFEKLCKEFGLGREVPDGDGWGVTWYPDPNVIAAFVELLAESQRTQAPSEPEWKRLRLTAWENRALNAEAALDAILESATDGREVPEWLNERLRAYFKRKVVAGMQAQAAQPSDEEPFHGSVMCDGPS